MLLGGCCVALGLSSLLALIWPDTTTDGILVEGLKSNPGLFVFVWLYSIFFWFVQDVLKVLAFKWMYYSNFNKISTTGVVVLPETALKLIAELDKALNEEGVASGGH
jgi:H+-transporting ATPase